jgi:hypothetical protein
MIIALLEADVPSKDKVLIAERITVDTAGKKRNPEDAILNSAMLANQLVKAVLPPRAVAVRIGIHPVIYAGSLAVYRDTEAHWLSTLGGSQHQMEVAGVKAIVDAASRRKQGRDLAFVSPIAFYHQAPIESA